MHAYLIVGNNIEEEIDKLTKSLGVTIIEQDLHKIAEVREFKQFARLTFTDKTAILSKNIDLATVEAQNALLKILEEPQENLYFILTASSLKNLLPTIVSRCSVIESYAPQKTSNKDNVLAKTFFNSSKCQKLLVTSKISSREDAVELLEKLIVGGHTLMIKNISFAKNLEATQLCLSNIKKNGNVQIQLTNLVVKLAH